jgi:hypothetical protein
VTSVTIPISRRRAVSLTLPAVGRKRLVCAGSLASTATTLWLAAPAYLPGAEVSAVMVLAGFGLPWSVAWVTLLAMERRIRTDLLVDANRGHGEADGR